MIPFFSLNVSCISTGKDEDLSAYVSRYVLNHHKNLQLEAIKSLIVFNKVVQIHINRVFQGEYFLQHLKSTGDEVSVSVSRLFSQTRGIVLVYDMEDANSFRALQAWIDILCQAFHCPGGNDGERKHGSLYGVLVGIHTRTASSSAAQEPDTVKRVGLKEAEAFAYKNNLQHFSVNLATSSQMDINKPMDFLSTLCAQKLLFRMHTRDPARRLSSLLSAGPAASLHMVQRVG